MSTEENKALMRRFLEASVSTDEAALRELLASDFVAHIPSGPANREAFVKHNYGYVTAFSDRQFEAEDLVAEGDKVVARATWRATHTGSFMGLPPTGKRLVVSAVITERFRDGQSVEHWSLFDTLGMMQQLGLVPPPQPAK